MPAKEAKARIKINNLLEQSGWRFFDGKKGKAHVILEPNVKLTQTAIDALGEDFEKATNGFIDFSCWINKAMLIFRPDNERISSSYLFHSFQSESFRIQKDSIISGPTQPQLPIRNLNEGRIRFSHLETQQNIVFRVEEEQRLVNANKELILIFEDNIKVIINRVWVESSTDRHGKVKWKILASISV